MILYGKFWMKSVQVVNLNGLKLMQIMFIITLLTNLHVLLLRK
ncbi:hypothetical protein [Salmonella phage SD-1_S14]|nr:hypothetical protein [Salmonella phage SD-1_S14]